MVGCVGLYCGRTKLSELNNYSDCGPCSRGFRTNSYGVCIECSDLPSFYDYMYITFMVFILMIIEWYITEQCFKSRKLTANVLALHSIVLFENIFSLLVTLLVLEPFGSLQLKTCPPKRLSDFYTLFFNPCPDYKTTIYCTQEAVYPLYTLCFVYYAISLISVLFRAIYLKIISFLLNLFSNSSFLQDLVNDTNTTKIIYLTLYVIPALVFIHAIFSGIIYYSFPYIIIIGSIISVAIHMAFQLVILTLLSKPEDQRPFKLLASLFQKKNCVIIVSHWLIHIYGIISLTQLDNLSLHLPLLCLAPVPTIFYVITSRFTDPNKLHIE